MKIKGIIFDLDGVIISTDEFHYLAWKKMADTEGIYFDRIINNRLRGVSRMESLEIILEKATKSYSDEQKLEMATSKNNDYRQFLNRLTPKDVSQEVLETLKLLKSKGLKMAIASSSKNTRLILQNIGLTEMFDAIVDGNDISHSKPNPEVFVKAQNKLGLENYECLVIEDAIAGIDAGSAAKIETCGIGDASKYSKTTYPITTISDILRHI